jgi:hypothetical protein
MGNHSTHFALAVALICAAAPAAAYCPMGYAFLGDDITEGQLPWEYCGVEVSKDCTKLLVTGPLGEADPLTGQRGLATRIATVRTAGIQEIKKSRGFYPNGYVDRVCAIVQAASLGKQEQEVHLDGAPMEEEENKKEEEYPSVFPQFQLPMVPLLR